MFNLNARLRVWADNSWLSWSLFFFFGAHGSEENRVSKCLTFVEKKSNCIILGVISLFVINKILLILSRFKKKNSREEKWRKIKVEEKKIVWIAPIALLVFPNSRIFTLVHVAFFFFFPLVCSRLYFANIITPIHQIRQNSFRLVFF